MRNVLIPSTVDRDKANTQKEESLFMSEVKKSKNKLDQPTFSGDVTPVVEQDVTEEVEETTNYKSLIDNMIDKVVKETGVEGQKNRQKAMRAIAYQAFCELIDSGQFSAVTIRALENAGNLPHGWKLFPEMALPKAKEPEEVVELVEEVQEESPKRRPVRRANRRNRR